MLFGKFIGLQPFPRAIDQWLDLNWRNKIQGHMSFAFCGKGIFVFLFENKAE